jgi:hypothetical protein
MPEFMAFCDESHDNDGRFRSIACVSLDVDHEPAVTDAVGAATRAEGLSEFKWNRCSDGRQARAAVALSDVAFKALDGGLRVDVLLWDIEDSRHEVEGRDDGANLERMFYHLLTSVMRRRPDGSAWHIVCDQKQGVAWPTLFDCLDRTGMRGQRDLVERGMFADFVKQGRYVIRRLAEVASHESPGVQLADLFAGLSVFSRQHHRRFRAWRDSQHGQGSLFASTDAPTALSRSDRSRFALVAHVNDQAKARKLGVSLDSTGGLRTRESRRPLNFWWWEPQSPKDKAPTKGS